MAEIYNDKPSKNRETDHELQELRRKSYENAASKLERERTIGRGGEAPNQARHEALELAKSHERKVSDGERTQNTSEYKHGRITTDSERQRVYNAIMDATRAQMSAPARAFSKVIHNPVVEKTSAAVGATVARPNAVLAGSVSALLLVLGVYAIAHFFGYPLSGFETIGAFIFGWIIGIIYDFFHAMITGKVN